MGGLEEARAKLFQHLRQEISDQQVLQAMESVPRERFVPSSSLKLAYEDIPLPIELGQTISQPFIVALMSEALELTGTEQVLEVGTGSGYQAAILSKLAKRVITVERHQKLADVAKNLLAELDCSNVEVHVAEQTIGWRQEAPYQGIIVTAGAPQVPQELLNQLDDGGRLVIPVGSRYEQDLLKISKRRGEIVTQNLGPCRFVPLIGPGAWSEEC